ncbi:MAG: 4-amino-4-deoxy-L-arabinose transferase [Planctomycetota bacterium]|nr:4-amino-4-deoxy-L-arabinose transferase [Planctomycetota bacterium]
MSAPSTTRRRESALIAGFTFVGAVLRFWMPARMGLNHFDEGVYAAFGQWTWQGKGLAFAPPELRFYAPPLYPYLVGLVSLFLPIGTDMAAIFLSQICGVLTIPAVAWLARRSFGPGAGAAAAALAAISGPHVAFSRMALTDSTLLLVWILALGSGARFLERPGLLRAIPFGVLVGLAMNTKYNGNLPGVIIALTVLWGLILPGEGGRTAALKAIGFGLISAAIAGLMYWPWYRFVEAQPEGYAGLLRHHRGYLSGPSAWPAHLRLQLGQAYALSGELTGRLSWGLVAWPLAWVGAWIADRGWWFQYRADRWEGMRFRVGLLVGAIALGAAPSIVFWLGLARLPRLLCDRRAGPRMIGMLWVVMAILTPLYHPYARLWLPLHAAGWLIVSDLIVRLGPSYEIAPSPVGGRRFAMVLVCLAIVLGSYQDFLSDPHPQFLGSPVERTDDVRNHAARLIIMFEGLTVRPTRVHVLARPALLYYLTRDATFPIAREAYWEAMEKSAAPGRWAVVDGVLLEKPAHRPESFDRFILRPSTATRIWKRHTIMTPTTALDVDPGLAFPLDSRVRTIIGMPLEP